MNVFAIVEPSTRRASNSNRLSVSTAKGIIWTSAFLLVEVLSPISPLRAAVVTGNGANPAGIQSSVDSFRALLGALNPNTAGSFGSGRREINWDGVPDSFSAPNNLPANFFNSNSPRGAVFSTAGTGFAVSADSSNPTTTPTNFLDQNAAYAGQFQTFSAQRLFSPLGSNMMQIDFFVPGSNTPAGVSGFGAVFADANINAASQISLFYTDNSFGGVFAVPTSVAGGLSFLGITSPDTRQYGRVVIQNGNATLGTTQNLVLNLDVVVMDDFVYGEPIAIPEPSSMVLTSGGFFCLTSLLRKRRKPESNPRCKAD